MSEKVENEKEEGKVPSWYLKIPEQIRKDGDNLSNSLRYATMGVFVHEAGGLDPQSPDFQNFAIVHKACVFYFKKIYDLTASKLGKLEKFKKLKNEKNNLVKLRKQEFKDEGKVKDLSEKINSLETKIKNLTSESYERTKKYLESSNHFSQSFISDSVIYLCLMLRMEYRDYNSGDKTPISFWVEKKKIKPENILQRIIQKHIEDIAVQNLNVEIDKEKAMQMPEIVVTLDVMIGGSNVVLTDLKEKSDLEIQGFLARNCAGLESWNNQIQNKEIKIFSIDIVDRNPKAGTSGKNIIDDNAFGENLPEGLAYSSFTENFIDSVERKFGVDLHDLGDYAPEFYSLKSLSEDWNRGDREDTDWNDEIESFFQKELAKLEKNLKILFCRQPMCTILYDVNKQAIEQVKLFDNRLVRKDTKDSEVESVVKAIMEICKRYKVKKVLDLEHLGNTGYWKENFRSGKMEDYKVIMTNGEIKTYEEALERLGGSGILIDA